MLENLKEKLLESVKSVLPFTLIVLVLNFTITPLSANTLALFLSGAFLLVIGVALFSLGADIAMIPMGELIGTKLIQSRKLLILLVGCFILGVAITVAEPDLQVLAKQIPYIPNMVLMLTVAVGVGVFLVFAVLRILFQIKLSTFLLVMYGILFAIAAFAPDNYLAVGFDSGGVTTGPITVPFILSLGVGLSAVSASKNAEEDSFGLVGICSIGPILAVLILGMFYTGGESAYVIDEIPQFVKISELINIYLHGFVEYGLEVLLALSMIVACFVVFQIFFLHLSLKKLLKIGIGLIYTLLGLTIFLTGVNIGFMPAGTSLGYTLAQLDYNWIIIPLAALLGFFIIAAEPSVGVLNKQVEDITSGAISSKMMMAGLSIGVALALSLAMIRIRFELSLWYFIIPGYIIALGLTFFVPKVFTGIAFDSGGVVSGTMATTFLLPFAMGVSSGLGGNPMTDAFGIIAIIAMMPLVTVQIMGVIYQLKMKKNIEATVEDESESILTFEQEEV